MLAKYRPIIITYIYARSTIADSDSIGIFIRHAERINTPAKISMQAVRGQSSRETAVPKNHGQSDAQLSSGDLACWKREALEGDGGENTDTIETIEN